MSSLFDPANARVITICLMVVYAGVTLFVITNVMRRPEMAAAASFVWSGLGVLVCTFVGQIPRIGYTSLVVGLGMVVTMVSSIALNLRVMYSNRASYPKPPPRRRVASGERFFRLVRSSVWSVEDGHRA